MSTAKCRIEHGLLFGYLVLKGADGSFMFRAREGVGSPFRTWELQRKGELLENTPGLGGVVEQAEPVLYGKMWVNKARNQIGIADIFGCTCAEGEMTPSECLSGAEELITKLLHEEFPEEHWTIVFW